MPIEILEKKGYNFSILGSLFTIGLGVVTLISTFILYNIEGYIPLGSIQIRQLIILITTGFILPSIVFLLNFLVDRETIKFKKDILIVSILTIAIGILLITFAIFFIDFLATGNYALGSSVAIIICLGLSISTQLMCIYGGVQNILYFQQKK
ncbi:MAG: hypothetical protein ACTSRC_06385 [Candidatus Helarchaeota archaeon]